MKLKPLARTFMVITADPRDARMHRLDVRAVSADDARRIARLELALEQQGHREIRFVQERTAA